MKKIQPPYCRRTESGNWCKLKMAGNRQDKMFRLKSQIVGFLTYIHLLQEFQECRSGFEKTGFTLIQGLES